MSVGFKLPGGIQGHRYFDVNRKYRTRTFRIPGGGYVVITTYKKTIK